MKKNNFFSTTKKALIAMVCSVSLLGLLSSCDENKTSPEEFCHKKGELYCKNAAGVDGCCESDVPWTDGHGLCYSTLSQCRRSGWACYRCL